MATSRGTATCRRSRATSSPRASSWSTGLPPAAREVERSVDSTEPSLPSRPGARRIFSACSSTSASSSATCSRSARCCGDRVHVVVPVAGRHQAEVAGQGGDPRGAVAGDQDGQRRPETADPGADDLGEGAERAQGVVGAPEQHQSPHPVERLVHGRRGRVHRRVQVRPDAVPPSATTASRTVRSRRVSWSTTRSTEARVPAREASCDVSWGAGVARSGRARSSAASSASVQPRSWSASVRGNAAAGGVDIRTTIPTASPRERRCGQSGAESAWMAT